MKKLLLINSVVNKGSTGRIVEQISSIAETKGYSPFVLYGRQNCVSNHANLRIGNDFSVIMHGLKSLLFDAHGFGSVLSTKKNLNIITRFDVIHLHNLHGYYINLPLLLNELRNLNKPVVWTFHDCWPFTGHCAYFDHVGCNKWINECYSCPQSKSYPSSLIDNSTVNFRNKKALFTSINKLHIVVPSLWLKSLVRKSFFSNFKVSVIYNGVNLDNFKPISKTNNFILGMKKFDKVILGVANPWTERKGLNFFIKLRELLPENYGIVLVGVSNSQIKNLPRNIVGLKRTNSVEELNLIYNASDVFVNPTLEDNFPTTNLEALAAGIPVVTFRTGGSGESVCDKTGRVVEKGDVNGLFNSIIELVSFDKSEITRNCRKRAEEYFDSNKNFKKYIEIYNLMTNEK